ncbi:MAG: acyloxyacyl hydrolase [Steroidobacteraceae bacterium]
MRGKSLSLALVVILVSTSTPVAAADLFAQAGWGEGHLHSYAMGAQQPLRWRTRLAGFNVRTYVELTLSRWLANPVDPTAEDRFTQLGAAPVLPLQRPMRSANFFIDAGIDACVITPRFRLDSKRFSTEFNFGDQLGFGVQFRRSALHEVSVRVQHLSALGT